MRVLFACSEAYPLAKTGGLGDVSDTIVDADERTVRNWRANGFAFREATAEAMLGCVDRALALCRQPVAWRRLQSSAMSRDFGWEASARRYLAVYRKLASFAPLPVAGEAEGLRELPVG